MASLGAFAAVEVTHLTQHDAAEIDEQLMVKRQTPMDRRYHMRCS
ncbi:hypothetical protein ACP70R_021185 [Stipagrostis hirtigluma subsp. patula]